MNTPLMRDTACPIDTADAELQIHIDKDQCVQYAGTRAQLEAEGVVPGGTEWPAGKNSVRWESNGFTFWLKRRRPHDMKGPMRLWLEGDYWVLTFAPSGHSYFDGELRNKYGELRRLLYDRSEEGVLRRREALERIELAWKDKQFQRFLTKIPALAEPEHRRSRRTKASAEPRDE